MAYTKCFQIPNGKTVQPLNNEKILLDCAGIFVGNFNTNDARLDAAARNKVFVNDNAIDYLVRCNDNNFVNPIIQREAIRQLLGSSNYAFNTLWANSYWRQKIFDYDNITNYMLNVVVPVMTAASTPSGQATASNYRSGYPAWKVFDGDDTSQWMASGTVASQSTGTAWLRYDWGYQDNTIKKRILAADFSYNTSVMQQTAFRVRYSDDGSTWTDMTSSEAVTRQLWTNDTAHRMWQINIGQKNTTGSATYCPRDYTLQFYGRDDV